MHIVLQNDSKTVWQWWLWMFLKLCVRLEIARRPGIWVQLHHWSEVKMRGKTFEGAIPKPSLFQLNRTTAFVCEQVGFFDLLPCSIAKMEEYWIFELSVSCRNILPIQALKHGVYNLLWCGGKSLHSFPLGVMKRKFWLFGFMERSCRKCLFVVS
jgi:hypothetical protein